MIGRKLRANKKESPPIFWPLLFKLTKNIKLLYRLLLLGFTAHVGIAGAYSRSVTT